jgi:hypothetical protein
MDRLSFVLDLCSDLRKEEINRCFARKRITSELRILIGSILQKPVPEKEKPGQILPGKRKRCYVCPSAKERKKSIVCYMCLKPVRNICVVRVCKRCEDKNQ